MGEQKEGAKPEVEKKPAVDADAKKDDGKVIAIYKIDMHCEGCAKKIKHSIKHYEGVEDVKTDCEANKLTVIGKVDPAKVRDRLAEKTKKKVDLISPQPKKDDGLVAAVGGGDKKHDAQKKPEEKKEEKKPPKESTVDLNIRTHCDGCIHKIQKIISKFDEQQVMISIEEIIAIQKREEAAQQQSMKEADQGASSVKRSSSTSQGQEKGITIKEGAPQTERSTVVEKMPQLKKDGKRKVGEPVENPPATRQRINSGGAVATVPVSVSEVSDTRLMIHPHPLFGSNISFKRDAPFPSGSSASLLNNPMYNIKLARSVVPVPDRQFIMKRNMGTNLSDLIDLSLKMTATLVDAADLHRYTQIEWEKTTNSLKAAVEKAEKAKEKAEKQKEVFENQFAVLESEKTELAKAVEEAKTTRDEAVAMANSLKSEQDWLIQVAQEEAKEKIAKAISERDDAIRALDIERVVQQVREKTIREEAVLEIVKYGLTFRRSALFMVKEKYSDLDFSDINFSDMKGHDNVDSPGPVQVAPVQPAEEDGTQAVEGEGSKHK